jgi:hypothetical protein
MIAHADGTLHSGDDPEQTIIHAKRRECPPGYHLVRGLFRERGGTREDAYVRDGPMGAILSIDMLKAGESLDIAIPLFIEEGKKP